jgi:hypothetical protein
MPAIQEIPMPRPTAVCLLACLVALPAAAEWGQFDYDFDANKKTWREIEAQLPPPPQPGNLSRIEVSSASANRFLVDRASLSVGEDRVVRYTLVVESPAGARNISFEGMRCDVGEYKIYAFGRDQGAWSRNRNARWLPVPDRQQTSPQRALFYHYLCTVEHAADARAIQRLLRSGGLFER